MLHSSKICNVFWGLSNIHFLAPTAVKHTCFIDPSRIAVQITHIYNAYKHVAIPTFSRDRNKG